MGNLECKQGGKTDADPAAEYKCNGHSFCRARVGLAAEAPGHDELLDGDVFEEQGLDAFGLYFLGPYRLGASVVAPGYVPSQRFGVDALLHEKTGVLVWSQALDFRGVVGDASGGSESDTCEAGKSSPALSDSACIFHYTGEATFRLLARQSHLVEVAVELLGSNGPFGIGLQACQKPPHLWESRAEILVNERWPRRDVVEECGGNAQLGPLDRHNTCLRRRLIQDYGTASISFCVPVLCRAEHVVLPLWPGGRNRWDEPQPQWRDVSLVSVRYDQRHELAWIAADAQLRVLKLRFEWQRAGDATESETLAAMNRLETALSDVQARDVAEAEILDCARWRMSV